MPSEEIEKFIWAVAGIITGILSFFGWRKARPNESDKLSIEVEALRKQMEMYHDENKERMDRHTARLDNLSSRIDRHLGDHD